LPPIKADNGRIQPPKRRWLGALAALSRGLGGIAHIGGHIAAVVMVVLAASVMLGIVLRAVGIDNSWTYDLDHFTLIWVAFFGAAFTALRGSHVTAGIALENMFRGRRALQVMAVVRFIIVAGFLILFIISGYDQTASSFGNHETTLDIVQWPVWIAKTALPVGALAWLIAEIHTLLERVRA
jgi:TRAP-type C4-dicarboxylate transport system permease small subunit